MLQFLYNAMDSQGNPVEGYVDADDLTLAAEMVRRMGYNPLKVQAVSREGSFKEPAAQLAAGAFPSRTTAPVDLTRLHQPERTQALPEESIETDRLEPWQRGGPLNPPPGRQGLAEPTQTIPAAPFNMPSTPLLKSSAKERIHPSDTVKQRFLEMFVYPVWSGVALKDLIPFYRQLATLLGAGIPLYKALGAMEENTRNKKLKEAAKSAEKRVMEGGTLSGVMSEYPWIFPAMHTNMTYAAEQAGTLEHIFRELADYVEHDLEIRRLISMETLHPKLTLFGALMILGGHFFVTGMPAVSNLVLGSMGKSPYTFTNYLSDTVGFGLLFLVPILALVVIFRLFLFNIKGVRESYDTVKTGIPGIGGLVKTFATARFLRTQASLYGSGFSMSSSMQIAGDSAGNVLLRNAAHSAAVAAERGERASDALARSGFFHSVALNMFRTGEEAGNLDDMLLKASEFYEAEGRMKIRQTAVIFSVTVFLIVALLVGAAIIRFYSGYASGISSAGG